MMGDRFWVAVGAGGVDVEQAVAGLAIEADADELVGVLPAWPTGRGGAGDSR
jgi:hypothetical protein